MDNGNKLLELTSRVGAMQQTQWNWHLKTFRSNDGDDSHSPELYSDDPVLHVMDTHPELQEASTIPHRGTTRQEYSRGKMHAGQCL